MWSRALVLIPIPSRCVFVLPLLGCHRCMLDHNKTPARHVPRKTKMRRNRTVLPCLQCACGSWTLCNYKRLSATDISALASMKNVAKCDTWCELQNPVNHRVFERKLRPKPFGRGHACLGVTHRVAPIIQTQPVVMVMGRRLVSRTCSGWPKKRVPSVDTRLVVV